MQLGNSNDKKYFSQKRVRKSFIHFIFGRALTSILSFSYAILVVRELSIEDYATYTIMVGIAFLSIYLSGLGLHKTVPKYLSEIKQKNEHLNLKKLNFSLTIIRIFSLFVFIFILNLFIAPIFDALGLKYSLNLAIYFFCYVFLFGLSLHLMKTLQVLLMQKEVSIGFSLEWTIKVLLLISILFYYEQLTLEQVFLLNLLPIFINITVCFYFQYSFIKKLDYSSDNSEILDIKNIYKFSLHNYFQTLAGFHVHDSVGRILAGLLASPVAVAALGFSYAVSAALKRYLPANLFIGLLEPVIMAKYSDSKSFTQVTLLTGTILKLNLFIVIPLIIWLGISGEDFINLASKDKFGEYSWVVAAMFFILALDNHRSILELICNAVDESLLLFTSNIVSYPLVFLWAILAYFFSIEGFIVGLISIMVFRNMWLERKLSNRNFIFKLDWFALCKMILVSLLSVYASSYIVSYFGELHNVIKFIVSISLIALIYLTLFFFIKVFNEDEREALNTFIGKRLVIW